MTAALYNPHFQFISIWATHKHVHVIIRLKHDSTGTRSDFDRLVGHPPNIGHDYERMVTHQNGIAHGLSRIMRHHKRPDTHPGDIQNLSLTYIPAA